ncbi:MAG TPA: glycoside hydrolase family 3 N-terminal domain-containing protein [Acidothermaceae bacterium]
MRYGDSREEAGLPWRDVTLTPRQRVDDLLARMTLEEKIGQLYGVWVGADASGEGVAPHQHELAEVPEDWDALIANGLGQLTRPFGTAPVDPALGARALARTQADIIAANRHGIPAVVHEECLSGFMTWGATIYPTPLSWGASFNPELVERMANQIGAAMRSVGVHQGLAPVLDVTRDYRWGRVEETIGEDPYLVGTIGAAYVRGLESAGVVATLKHFVGYSASRAGRNFGPVSAGPRELADVLLPPFEMAIRDGGARSVMHSYAEIDGVPAAANQHTLTEVLRDTWGFEGTVVADYFGVSFLHLLHHVAADDASAAALALGAGVDVELPTMHCYGQPLIDAVRAGVVKEELVDRAARRVLLQKCELGLLDLDWRLEPPALTDGEQRLDGDVDTTRGTLALDPPESRALARQLAEQAIVLVANNGALPLSAGARVAVVGPRADDPLAMFGCYSFPSHVGSHHPELPWGITVPTVLDSIRAELPNATVTYTQGCEVDTPDTSGIPDAAAAARAADVCVVALGDRADLFGRGTSGEGCDALDLSLPGVQGELLEALLQTGKPVVAALLTGRPYSLGAYADRLAGVVQAFFPGEEGGPAIAGVLAGRVNPSGRLPVSLPASPGGQPATYLTPLLGQRSEVSNIDPTPLWPFGHGLSYTTFEWDDVRVGGQPVGDAAAEIGTDGAIEVSIAVRNVGERAGADVVQLYLHDPVAQVTRPETRLIGYARVELEAGERREVAFQFAADLSSFTGLSGERVVEPGDLEVRFGRSSTATEGVVRLRLTGPQRVVGVSRQLVAPAVIR